MLNADCFDHTSKLMSSFCSDPAQLSCTKHTINVKICKPKYKITHILVIILRGNFLFSWLVVTAWKMTRRFVKSSKLSRKKVASSKGLGTIGLSLGNMTPNCLSGHLLILVIMVTLCRLGLMGRRYHYCTAGKQQ